MNHQILDWQKSHLKKNIPQIRPGDRVRIHQLVFERGKDGQEKERVQIFEGVVIALKHGQGLDGTFTVRRLAVDNIGVERVFPLHSPTIVKVERLKTSQPRRAKLYFLRHSPKRLRRLRAEKTAYTVWEEGETEEELEKIKAEQEAEAKQKETEKGKEAEELEKKFTIAQAAKQKEN